MPNRKIKVALAMTTKLDPNAVSDTPRTDHAFKDSHLQSRFIHEFCRQLERELAQAQEQLREAQQQITGLERLVYVPGTMKCAKCGFVLVTNVLNANTGEMGSDNRPKQCANGCGPLWRLTERDAGNEMVDRCIKQQERTESAEAKNRELAAQVVVITKATTDLCDFLLDRAEPIGPFHSRGEYPPELAKLLDVIANLPAEAEKLMRVVDAAKTLEARRWSADGINYEDKLCEAIRDLRGDK